MPRSPRAAAGTSPRQRLNSLELGRFVAASLVVVYHLADALRHFAAVPGQRILGGWAPSGDFGVEYFFVLSGFVMLVAHRRDFGRLPAIPRFFWRRLARIYPTYWLALLIPFFILHLHWSAAQALGMITLTSDAVPLVVPPAWSLQYELVFYVIFALALAPFIGPFLLALWAYVVIWLLLPVPWQRITTPIPAHILRHALVHHSGLLTAPFDLFFIAGLLAAWLYLVLPLGAAAGGLIAAGAAALLLAAGPSLGWYAQFPAALGYVPLCLGLGGVLAGLAALERAGTLTLGRRAARLGEMSYPLYILHVPLLLILESQCAGWLRLPLWGLYALAALCLVALYGSALLVTLLFDQPLQRALRHPGGRR
jgi:peptidoglycan/LPS O-acetylase OafA/YrhL